MSVSHDGSSEFRGATKEYVPKRMHDLPVEDIVMEGTKWKTISFKDKLLETLSSNRGRNGGMDI